MSEHERGSQGPILGSQFSPSPVYVLGIELSLPALVASAFVHLTAVSLFLSHRSLSFMLTSYALCF